MENWKDAISGNSRSLFRTSSTNAFTNSSFTHLLFPGSHLQVRVKIRGCGLAITLFWCVTSKSALKKQSNGNPAYKGCGRRKKKNKKKNKRGQRRFSALNHQATVQPGSRWGRNCLSELPAVRGIRHMPTLHPLSHSSTDPDNQKHKQPPTHLSTHILCCALWGNRWRHMGTFPLAVLTTVNQAALSLFVFSCQFSHSDVCCWCSTAAAKPDTDASVREQRWGNRSSSLKAGASALALLGLFSFKYLCHYRAFTCTCFGAEGAIKSQLVKTPHFHSFS